MALGFELGKQYYKKSAGQGDPILRGKHYKEKVYPTISPLIRDNTSIPPDKGYTPIPP